jgi:hypothetical protein
MRTEMKVIGYAGAQRVGKTTLGKFVEDKLLSSGKNAQFVSSKVYSILSSNGLDVKRDCSPEERLTFQIHLLSEYSKIYHSTIAGARGVDYLIFDRTPLCFLGYMMADVTREFPYSLIERYDEYIADCCTALGVFDKVFLIKPGVPLAECFTSSAANLAYMWHFTNILSGVVANVEQYGTLPVEIMPSSVITYQDRFNFTMSHLR